MGAAGGAAATASAPTEPPMRLGLRLEQRGDVRRLVDNLQLRVNKAVGDLQVGP